LRVAIGDGNGLTGERVIVAETFGEAVQRWRTRWGLSLRQLAEKAHVDPGHLSRIERGERPPTENIAKSCDLALEAGGQLARLVISTGEDVPFEPMRRRNLLQASVAAATLSGLGMAFIDPATIGRVGAADVNRLSADVRRLYALDYAHGGDQLWELAAARAAKGYALLEHGTYTEEIGARLLSATGRAQLCAGWLAFDAGRHEVARVHFTEALALGRQGSDDQAAEIEASALANLALQSNTLGRPREGLRFAMAAEHAAPDSVAGLAALPRFRRAIAWSLMGDAASTNAEISNARRLLDDAQDKSLAEWYAFVHQAEMDAIEATCAMGLGQPRRAEGLLSGAIGTYGDRFGRNRALLRVRLAQARLDGRQVEGAVEAADAALEDLAGEVVSWRINTEFDRAIAALSAYPDVPGVQEVIDRYHAAMQTAAG
jgi:transcriptional regulator with XRE-family HTH domain